LRTFLLRLQPEWTRTGAFVYKNWIMARSNVFTLFEILFWPLVSFLSVGFLTKFAGLGHDMKAFILIGVVSFSAVQVCQLDVAYVLLYDVWSKAIKHGFIAPVGIRHLFVGSLVMGVIRGGAVFFILMLASRQFFGFDFTVPGILPTALYLFGLFLCAAMVGLLVCILVLILGNRAEVAAWSMVSLMMLICGIYYPVSTLPESAARVATAIPLTYFLEYFRQFYGFTAGFPHALARGYAMVFLYLAIELLLLKAAVHRAKKTGMLLRLSE
jgi:ABC-2 type transport system permease protein